MVDGVLQLQGELQVASAVEDGAAKIINWTEGGETSSGARPGLFLFHESRVKAASHRKSRINVTSCRSNKTLSKAACRIRTRSPRVNGYPRLAILTAVIPEMHSLSIRLSIFKAS